MKGKIVRWVGNMDAGWIQKIGLYSQRFISKRFDRKPFDELAGKRLPGKK